MYSFENILTGLRYPQRALVELYSIGIRLTGGPRGVDIPNADWDNLVILDACRYDVFKEYNRLPGDLEPARSRATHTGEFLLRNFGDGTFEDMVYVSAHPRPSEYNAAFHDVYHLWETEWNDELNTVPPRTVTEIAARVHDEYPNKRILVHYVQPHYPFIGEKGRNFHQEHGYTSLNEDNHVFLKLRRGEISRDLLWNLYVENLETVLPHVKTLVEHLRGKTVVTSDHGNAFGEWDVYGHPARTYIKPLTQVPWLVVEGGPRKSIEKEKPRKIVEPDEEGIVSERLAALGYTNE